MNPTDEFRRVFGHDPVVTAKAPGRVNLIGEHTDYNDGFVLPTAIPQTTQVALARSQKGYQVYSANHDHLETFDKTGPLRGFARYVGGCFRVLESEGLEVPPLRAWIATSIPIGAGLSSSAALEVATLRAVDALLGLGIDPVRLARLAQRAEREHAGVNCGIMDQMASSLATAEVMLFLDTRTLERRVLPLPKGSEVLVIDSGVPRALSNSVYNLRREQCAEAARALGVASLRDVSGLAAVLKLPSPLREVARHVVTENERVVTALDADACGFGLLMNASHASLRDDYDVSIGPVDVLVEQMQKAPGVFGARMTGAGFGGACVALVEKGRAASIGDALCSGGVEPRRRVVVPCEKTLT
jgi:galactokinase